MAKMDVQKAVKSRKARQKKHKKKQKVGLQIHLTVYEKSDFLPTKTVSSLGSIEELFELVNVVGNLIKIGWTTVNQVLFEEAIKPR